MIATKTLPDVPPEVFTPGLYWKLGLLRLTLLPTGLVSAALTPLFGVAPLAVGTLLMVGALLAPHALRSIIASGIDDEVPSLVLYLIPYAWSPHTVADLIARIAYVRRGFRWLRLEARRLSMLLDWGLDPLTALQKLSHTTPSASLREVLDEFIHASRTGFPRSLLLARLAERALEGIRRRWQSYSELSRTLAEANAAIIVAAGVMAPLASVSGGSAAMVLPLSVLLPALGALASTILQPASGPGRTGLSLRLAPLLAGYVFVALALTAAGSTLLPLIAFGALATEAYGFRASMKIRRALRALGVAAREARLGRLSTEMLEEAANLDRPVFEAIIEAVRVGGATRIWTGLEMLERAYRSALRAVESTRSHAIMTTAVTLVSLAVSWYALGLMASLATQSHGMLPSAAAAEAAPFIRASAVAAGLSAGVLLRPRLPSLLPSLAMILTLTIMSSMGLGPL